MGFLRYTQDLVILLYLGCADLLKLYNCLCSGYVDRQMVDQ